MSYFDIFLQKSHPHWLKKLFIRYNRNILSNLISLFPEEKKINLLEIGPGKGYFFQVCKKQENKITYSAVDRNSSILKNLQIKRAYQSIAPRLPRFDRKFDIIYAACLIEHLKNGEELFELIANCRKNLSTGGKIVFLAPNAKTCKMEFWNMDYTHAFPTTKMNVAMAFYDNNFKLVSVTDYTDIAIFLTAKSSNWPLISRIVRFIFLFYDYKIFSAVFSFLNKKPSFSPENWFYRLYNFTKIQNLMFFAGV